MAPLAKVPQACPAVWWSRNGLPGGADAGSTDGVSIGSDVSGLIGSGVGGTVGVSIGSGVDEEEGPDGASTNFCLPFVYLVTVPA